MIYKIVNGNLYKDPKNKNLMTCVNYNVLEVTDIRQIHTKNTFQSPTNGNGVAGE